MTIQRAMFIALVVVAAFGIALANSIPIPSDANTAESIGPHFIAWLLLLVGSFVAIVVPEWRLRGWTWQKTCFVLAPLLIIADTLFHYVTFGSLGLHRAQLSGIARTFSVFTYFGAAVLLVSGLVALLTQVGRRPNTIAP